MPHEKEIDNIIKKLEAIAKRHNAEIDIKLDGSTVAAVRLEHKGSGGLTAVVGIRNFKKALSSPELLKAALSFFALKKRLGTEHKIGIEFEKGMIKRLFGGG